jgi:hypothetical protein
LSIERFLQLAPGKSSIRNGQFSTLNFILKEVYMGKAGYHETTGQNPSANGFPLANPKLSYTFAAL